ncbi:FAD binding domain-containing protein [Kineosporia sp. J2-2]|uniref:FAD binding domain-containing protein n=1 Tax=Kineosporia corallincola TaxID=2835133 RepID=A0ABS5TQ50_9ACTN|nr:FAD binding domain-containing protein [Kineosporia corallincola]MBT0773202.1 FAD binding domain-containing protein [Kineosporia corallincola]
MPTTIVNGKSLQLGDFPANGSALDALRAQGLLGAKEGCAEGECGACAVLVARPGVASATEWTAVNACLMPAGALAGMEVRTSEGLAGPDGLHPVQRELAERGGSQCGYCTPGFVCSMAAEYYRPDRGEHFDLHALSGNLCRCTGYRPIRDAATALGRPAPGDPLAERCSHAPPTPEPGGGAGFLRPATLAEALDVLARDPAATVVSGATDLGVDINLKGLRPELIVSIGHLDELRTLEITDESVRFGAALTLTELERRLDGRVPLLAELFPQFASRLIRNSATAGGSLGTASPIGDLAPVLLALDAGLVLTSAAGGDREVPLADYFTGYRATVARPGEIIRDIRVPLPLPGHTAFQKIAKRRYDDISSVAVALALDLDDDGVVTRARIGLGGVAATPVRALATEAALTGRPFTEDTIEAAAAVLGGEGTPLDDHRASAAFRSAMLGESLRRFGAGMLEAR